MRFLETKVDFMYLVTPTEPLFSDLTQCFSESRKTSTVSLIQVFLHIFKELQYVKHMDCEALT